jgi:hypothetical protein
MIMILFLFTLTFLDCFPISLLSLKTESLLNNTYKFSSYYQKELPIKCYVINR